MRWWCHSLKNSFVQRIFKKVNGTTKKELAWQEMLIFESQFEKLSLFPQFSQYLILKCLSPFVDVAKIWWRSLWKWGPWVVAETPKICKATSWRARDCCYQWRRSRCSLPIRSILNLEVHLLFFDFTICWIVRERKWRRHTYRSATLG